ncbi:hypothetical protein ADH72_11795 [Akkermansia muciniphila]|nr:hypothetical protein A4V05_04000 [Akkermansia muciniphila]ASB36308.1 hypothetical protein ADH72_11795 [Akkermansia muciniphila]
MSGKQSSSFPGQKLCWFKNTYQLFVSLVFCCCAGRYSMRKKRRPRSVTEPPEGSKNLIADC